MSTAVPPTGSTSNSSSSSSSPSNGLTNGLNNVNINQFLQMMIAELQNQDPMNPESNSQIMQELGQMQQITASNNLNTTLSSVALGQAIGNATSLIGKKIDGIDDSGNPANGVVQKVSIVNNTPKLYVGTQTVSLSNVADVLPAS
jgi:flagellar basal-body rod modification protein FlgD